MPRRLSVILALLCLAAPARALDGGDPERGRAVYDRCLACHALERNRTGPKHCGLLGRRAGSLPGFDYSEAMRSAGIVWTAETLDRFLRAPLEMLPETTMTYDGIADPQERSDLIAFLARAGTDPELCR